MIRSARVGCAGLILLGLLGGEALCADPVVYRSDRSFDETVQQLEWVFGGYGLTTVAALDYQQILKGIKVPSGRAVIFEVVRLEWLKILVTEDPALGIALPVRVHVFEGADGTTVVSYQSPGAGLQTHEKERVRAVGRQVDQKLGALVIQATRAPQSTR